MGKAMKYRYVNSKGSGQKGHYVIERENSVAFSLFTALNF